MKKGLLTKGQLQNIVKFVYDVCKIVAGGGIITPLIRNEAIDVSLFQWVIVVVSVLFTFAVFLDGVADRMGE